MSTVYAARQESRIGTGRLVALKVMAPAVRDRTRIKLFLREALISTQLDHPNIVRTYEVVRSRGKLYLAMEFLHGVDLASALRTLGGPLPVAVALRVGIDVAGALHAAHEYRDGRGELLGIVHQDVSPHNVMLTYDGSTKLLDFGVARLLSIDASWTASPKTKTAYVAPEQVTYGRLDRRVDIFALGLVLWELCTGKRLFARPTLAETIGAVVSAPIPDVRAENPAVPAGFAQAIARALDRDPEARFQDAAALREALRHAGHDGAIAPPEASEIAAWLREALPPTLSPVELETEIVVHALGSGSVQLDQARTGPLAMLPRRDRKKRGILSFVPPPLLRPASESDPDAAPLPVVNSAASLESGGDARSGLADRSFEPLPDLPEFPAEATTGDQDIPEPPQARPTSVASARAAEARPSGTARAHAAEARPSGTGRAHGAESARAVPAAGATSRSSRRIALRPASGSSAEVNAGPAGARTVRSSGAPVTSSRARLSLALVLGVLAVVALAYVLLGAPAGTPR